MTKLNATANIDSTVRAAAQAVTRTTATANGMGESVLFP